MRGGRPEGGARARVVRRLLRGTRPLLVALLIVVAARPAPIASGPRPTVELGSAVADRTAAPVPHVDARFATLPYEDELGRPGTWVLAASAKPLTMVVERAVADRYGLDAVGRALEVWNGTPGSDFAVHLAGVTDEGVDGKRRDGTNRVFLDQQSCGERFLARAHLFPAEIEAQDGRSVAWVTEVDIGVCERLARDLLAPVIRHELAHVAGVGHLCEPGEECWTPPMGTSNRCRIMATAAYPCQTPTLADEEALAHLHPRLPRIAARDAIGSVAATTAVLFGRAGSEDRVVVTDAGATVELQLAAAVYAGVVGAPHLLADGDCTEGRDGAELNRLAAIDATVVLVGGLPGSCEDELHVGWRLDVERLADVDAVAEALAREREGAPTRLVVAPTPTDAAVPAAAIAVPAAVALGAPLVTAPPDELAATIRRLTRAIPSIRGVVVVATTHAFGRLDAAALETATGVRVRPIDAPDGVDLALKVARMRDVFASGPIDATLVAADGAADVVAAASLAAATGSVVLPVFAGPASPDVRLAEFLETRIRGGYLVADTATIAPELQVRLSRAVDGAR